MSQDAVIDVIKKALMDTDFRDHLLKEPAAVLNGLDLTEEERQALSNIKKEAFDTFAGEVEQRVSKAGISPISLMYQAPPYVPVTPFDDRMVDNLLGGGLVRPG
jgi:hypothetical protein